MSSACALETDLDALLERIGCDASRHMTGGPASEDLARLELAIGHVLPEAFRAFLRRFGGGLYYERHEIFGPTRTMIHDIELVPPLPLVCRGLPSGVIPVHRVDAIIHFMDLRQCGTAVPVFSLTSHERYSDFPAFLRDVVAPPRDATASIS